MTTDLTTQQMEPRYIINTPSGYFVLWSKYDSFPKLATDRKTAAQLSSTEADKTIKKLKRLGFLCAKIEVNP
jgi:hypothetical protein